VTPAEPARQAVIWNIIRGTWRYPAMLAFTQLGCPDQLAAQPLSTEALAGSCDADPAALGRVLRCCASLGLVIFLPEGRWALTAAGHTLRQGGTMRAAVLASSCEPAWLAMLALDDAVRAGAPVFTDFAGGQDFYAWHASHPEHSRVFQEFMAARSAAAGAAGAGLDFTGATTVADIGGGHGTILAAILAAHPRLRGILLDRKDVLPGAQAHLTGQGLADRCELMAGDYLDPAGVPPADVYLLGSILHNHGDGEARQILANLLAASPGARVICAEILLPDDPGVPDIGTDLDIRRLVIGGRERTRAEWAALLGSAGLAITATVPAVPLTIIDARPAAAG
jgi:hypothetical protein